MRDLAREILADLEPSEGWWKSDTQDILESQAVRMLETMNTDDVTEILDTIISAMRAEYGE